MFDANQQAYQAKIDALSEAIRAVANGLSLEGVLNRLAEIAAHLVNARYAALGVPSASGGLEAFFTYGMTEGQIARMDHYPHGHGLLGELLEVSDPIRLEDMRHDSRSAGFCANHPRMTSFLGVPIIAKGRHLGSLYLSDRLDDQPFSEEDERMITLLAAHAAIAIENANLSDQLRRLAVVEERDRIAMELHDGIIQSIYAIGIKLELTRVSLSTLTATPEGHTQINEGLAAAENGLNHVIEDLRRYIRDLKVGVDLSVRLNEQLQEIAEGFRSVSGAQFTMTAASGFTHLSEAYVHGIVQIAREALSNVARHAKANQVSLDLHEDTEQITLTLTDDGDGFETDSPKAGRGLQNMSRRAAQLGGTLTIDSHPGDGTTLTLTLPI